jgi:hypothetical protein
MGFPGKTKGNRKAR